MTASPNEELVNGFVPLQELSLTETPVIVTLIDGYNGSESRVCVGYKNSFDLINERSGEVITLFQTEPGKVMFVFRSCGRLIVGFGVM